MTAAEKWGAAIATMMTGESRRAGVSAERVAAVLALYSARDALYRGEGPDTFADSDLIYGEWLGNRADRLAAQPTADGEGQ